jgi:hypothetical protein
MLRHPWRLAAISSFALLLSACQVSVAPPVFDPPIAANIAAQDSTNPSARLSNVVLQPGATLYYRVDVPTPRDLLYGEAVGTGVRVRWRATDGTSLAVSESPTFFAGSLADLSAAATAPTADAGPDPSAIATQYVCIGPCAAIAPTASTYILSVHNTTNTVRTFNLFVYTFAANDLNDRGAADNQTRESATPVAGGSESGAIELVGDRDWYRYTGPAGPVLTFSVFNPELGLRLRFDDGTTLTGAPGFQTTTMKVGDHFQVYSEFGRAGPSGTSGYTIQIGN